MAYKQPSYDEIKAGAAFALGALEHWHQHTLRLAAGLRSDSFHAHRVRAVAEAIGHVNEALAAVKRVELSARQPNAPTFAMVCASCAQLMPDTVPPCSFCLQPATAMTPTCNGCVDGGARGARELADLVIDDAPILGEHK